jgi:hypothetical protein
MVSVLTHAYSLGEEFTPLAAYAPTGPDALVSRVYDDPVEKTVHELSDLDPFENMVSILSFLPLFPVCGC